jgi:glycosyltransferase involved in cell wall biosynthesis
MKISVVVPAYNEEEYIEACLRSILQQTEPADEIIIVDNNSTDRTGDIARSLGVTVLTELRAGVINARNTGFDAATGDVIVRTDADCRVPENWISEVRKVFSAGDIDALTGPVSFHDMAVKHPIMAVLLADVMALCTGGKQLTIGPNMGITSTMWKKIRPWLSTDPTQVHEDYDIALWVYAAGGTVVRDDRIVVEASGRRIMNNPASFFIEYPLRAWKTFRLPRSYPRSGK